MVLGLVATGCGGESSRHDGFRQSSYTLPPELTNPIDLPPGVVTSVNAACGDGFHDIHLGPPIANVGDTLTTAGNRCEIAEVKTVWWNGAQHSCYRCELTADDMLHNVMDLGCASDVTVWPVDEPGCHERPTEGGQGVGSTSVLTDIFTLAGINSSGCATDPLTLDDNPGWIEEHDPSGVLNEEGTRATFGFFITFQKNGTTVEYFVLFSYDRLGANLCATELFLWGPITRDGNGDIIGSPGLIIGAAVNGNGGLLDEVPIELADVSNTLGGDSRPVQVGTHLPGQGCLECHNDDSTGADQTYPFPWDSTSLNDGCDGGTSSGTTGDTDTDSTTGGTSGFTTGIVEDATDTWTTGSSTTTSSTTGGSTTGGSTTGGSTTTSSTTNSSTTSGSGGDGGASGGPENVWVSGSWP
ncbi:MAG: hypothetical protein K0V04_36655 [Deltaproteobacteria bacterium]|nr:hypothetical protein [Deltaproteobacteria bacterium]